MGKSYILLPFSPLRYVVYLNICRNTYSLKNQNKTYFKAHRHKTDSTQYKILMLIKTAMFCLDFLHFLVAVWDVLKMYLFSFEP